MEATCSGGIRRKEHQCFGKGESRDFGGAENSATKILRMVALDQARNSDEQPILLFFFGVYFVGNRGGTGIGGGGAA
jgi:hypothetical protein